MAQGSFAAAVSAWCRKSEVRMEAVFKIATQMTIEQMQTTVNEGGNLPIDTGFLRASLLVETSVPTPRAENPADGQTYNWESGEMELVILGAALGDTIYATYGAAYARFQEYGFRDYAGRGFVRKAAQNWQKNVKAAEAQVRGAING